MSTLNIDGKIYELVSDTSPSIAEDNIKRSYVVVRTYSAGVFVGYLKQRTGREVTLANARRIYKWAGAATLSQLSVDGTSKPEECKFPCEVPEVLLLEAIEILPCSEKARKSINKVKIWQE